jgi:asparagine synthase (glutamine-hydrolysing)
MCGIAGIMDLEGGRRVPEGAITAMTAALVHRGPDEDGFLEEPGLALGSRRLSIVGLADGRQPIFNEDSSVAVVYNGELFEYPELKARLEDRGHRFSTHCDTELIPHLWEDHQEGMFEHLRGQFALALWDQRRQLLILARDRFGICPLYWTRQGDWLLFASEIKGLLASGMVEVRADVRGLDNMFNFFSLPGRVTCFAGIQALEPGRWLHIEPARPGARPRVTERAYWRIDFPDRGQEEDSPEPRRLVDGFEEVLYAAVRRRLRADVPVVSYLSGGVDSSMMVALASKSLGRPIPTFTIQVPAPGFDETGPAAVVSRHVGAKPIVVRCGDGDVIATYPQLIHAAEAPVVDASCTGLLLLARAVHEHGYKVALTGEGSDEWLAGYPWFHFHRLLTALDAVPGLRLGQLVRRIAQTALGGGRADWDYVRRAQSALGGPCAIHELYALISLGRRRFFSRQTLEALGDYLPYEDLGQDPERLRRWHPLNRSLYWGARIHLAGHLLSSKSDRIAMHSSVETRPPFLDEDVFAFLARLHPRWKLRGLWDKYILRLLAERWLPRSIAWRPKQMFRTPSDSFSARRPPAFVEELLSEEALGRTGYFDVRAVRSWWQALRAAGRGTLLRTPADMALVGVVATQLWHFTFLEPAQRAASTRPPVHKMVRKTPGAPPALKVP